MKNFRDQVKGKNILIFGLGIQGGGEGDRNWLIKEGAIVRVSDANSALSDEGQTAEQIDWAEIIIKNPGVPDNHELILRAKAQGKLVLTSIAVYVQNSALTTIGVTGTRGKSTVTALIAKLLEKAYPTQVLVGGNVPGTSGLKLFDLEKDKKYAVLELSSFQLHNFHDLKVSPNIAIVTNLYPDHLNRYKNMDEYRQDKEAIVKYQSSSDLKIINRDNPDAVLIGKQGDGKLLSFSAQGLELSSSLPGEHNRENLAAMVALANALNIDHSLCQAVANEFSGLPFRLETRRVHNGITYINDTTSTTPVATIKAIEALTNPTILICGGAPKNLPTDELVEKISSSKEVKHIVILGSKGIPEFVSRLKELAGDKVLGQHDNLESALREAKGHAGPGWNVLLSPGFASFDLFKNEFDRGEQFNELVRAL